MDTNIFGLVLCMSVSLVIQFILLKQLIRKERIIKEKERILANKENYIIASIRREEWLKRREKEAVNKLENLNREIEKVVNKKAP